MDAPIDPDDHTVPELREAVEDIDDPEALDAILSAERDGENRTTAIEAIEERLNSLEAAISEERNAIQPIDSADSDVLTLAGPDEPRELSERLLTNLSGIRTTLEEARNAGGQYEARLRKLENEVSELSAYTDALEDFLDDEGTAQQILESVEGDLRSLEEDIHDIKPVVRNHANTLRDHRIGISDLEDGVQDQSSTLEEVLEQVDSLDARFEDFRATATETHDDLLDRVDDTEDAIEGDRDRIENIADDLDSVRMAVDEASSTITDLETTISSGLDDAADERESAENRIDSNEEAIEAQGSSIDQLESTTTDIDRRLQNLEEDLEDIQTWREQLGAALGGGGAQEAPDGN